MFENIRRAALEEYKNILKSILKEEKHWEYHLPGRFEFQCCEKRYLCIPKALNRETREVFLIIEEMRPVGHTHIHIDEMKAECLRS